MTTGQESKMDDFTQIRVGKHKIGIIGLKAALAETYLEIKGRAPADLPRFASA